MLKKLLFLVIFALVFVACQNEGAAPSPDETGNMVEVEIDGEVVVIDMTPPPVTTEEYWEHIGFTRLADGTIASVWEDRHAKDGDRCKWTVYVGNKGFRCTEGRKPNML